MDGLDDYLDRASHSSPGLFFRHKVQKGIDFIASMGAAGEEIARQIKEVSRPAMHRRGIQQTDATRALRGLSKADRIRAAKIADGQSARGASPAAAKAGKRLKEILDRDLADGMSLGDIMRTVGGMKRPLGGSGKAFPTTLNAKGRRVVEEAYRRGAGSPRVKALLEEMVKSGKYADEDHALAALRQFRDQQLRGTSPYFERERLTLPDDYREWDPNLVLPRHFERTAFFLEGARRWGADFQGLQPLIARLSRESGEAESKIVENFIRTKFGLAGTVPRFDQRVYGALSNYETLSKLTGIFSPVLNFGQRFVNSADMPLSAQFRALKDLPPGLNAWLPASRKLKEWIRRTGAISGINPVTELAAQGPRGARLAKTLLAPFMVVARGNEFHSALVARYALEADITALHRIQGRNGPLGKMFEMIRALAIDPKGATARRIERRGLDPEKALDMFRKGERMNEAEWAAIMQKAVEDEQFALNIMTEPIWWDTNPFLRLLFKFKTFTVRQTGFIYERIAKEAMLGNVAPLIKFLGAAAIMGEAYHLSKDILSGKDQSVTSLLAQRDPEKRTQEEIAARVLANMGAQGAFGVVADLHYGLTNFIIGPAGSSVQTLLDAGAHLNQDPTQVGTVIREAVRDEIVLSRQTEALLIQAKEAFDGTTHRFRNYHRIRNAAFEFQEKKNETGIAQQLTRAIDRALTGPIQYRVTDRTLRYQYAARSVTAQDVEAAGEYLGQIFSKAESPREVIDLANSAKISMRRNAPMGNLSEADRKEFLSLLSPSRRTEARRLRSAWIRDYEAAIRAGRREALQEIRNR